MKKAGGFDDKKRGVFDENNQGFSMKKTGVFDEKRGVFDEKKRGLSMKKRRHRMPCFGTHTMEYSRPKVSLAVLKGLQRGLGLEYSSV